MKLVRKRKARRLVEAARAYLDRQSEHQVSRLLGRRAQLRPWRPGKQGGQSRVWSCWQKWELALLGKLPDREVARQTGRTLIAVLARRRRHHILDVDNQCRWQPWEIKLLGKYPDREVSRRTGRSWNSACKLRHRLGIERLGGNLRRWTRAEVKLLRKAKTRAEAVRLIGRSMEAVHRMRSTLGLPRPPHPHCYRPGEDALLGTMPDPIVAKRLGRTVEAIKSRRKNKGIPCSHPMRRWTKAEDRILLSCAHEQEAAQRLDRPVHAVQYRRKQLRTGAVGRRSRPWTPREIARLGKGSDVAVGRQLRRTFSAVRGKRHAMGILSHWARIRRRRTGAHY